MKKEMVHHPKHYGGEDNPCETIKVIKSIGGLHDFCIGNALKYIMRAGKKDQSKTLEDLEKAKWYLEYLIQDIRNQNVQTTQDLSSFYTAEEKKEFK